jgi:ankyrin repeat protein
MSALRRANDIYYGAEEESGIDSVKERIRDAVVNGADPNLASQGTTALYVAIMEDDTALALMLLDHGAKVSARDLDQDGAVDSPPLLSAISDVEEINPDMVAALIKAGSPLDGDGDFQPPLNAAIEAGSIETVKKLLQAGADANGHKDWESPMALAVAGGYVDMFDLLLAAGAKVQDTADLLVGAAGSGNLQMLQRILPRFNGPKAGLRLFQAAAWGLLLDEGEAGGDNAKIMMQQLREAGFEPAPEEFSELMVSAAQTLNANALEALVAYGASANAANNSGESCLMLAIEAASASNMMESENGLKGLFEYQDSHVKEIVRLLLDHGAEVNVQDAHGRTALMRAASAFNVSAVRMLMARGADNSLLEEKGLDAARLMLSIRLLHADKQDKAGRLMMAVAGITPEFIARVRERAQQVLVELKSDLKLKSAT